MRADRVLEQVPRLRAQVAGQAGLVTRRQAVGSGIGDEAIRWALATGRWTTVHPGVYLTTPGRDDWEVRAVAALLFVGGPVALCGPSAALAWGLDRREPGAVHVIVPAGRRASIRPGIEALRSRRFDERIDGFAWPHRTTVEHTVLDLGMRAPLDRVLGVAARACQQRLTDEARLADALASRSDQTHRALLRECLADVGDGAESAAEVRYIRDVERAHGLPAAARQYDLGTVAGATTSTAPSSSSSRWTVASRTRAGAPGSVTAYATGHPRGWAGSRCGRSGPTWPSLRARSRWR